MQGCRNLARSSTRARGALGDPLMFSGEKPTVRSEGCRVWLDGGNLEVGIENINHEGN
jgi:hypothetical protein